MANIIKTGGGGKTKKYLIKNGEYVVQPRATTGNITQFENSVRIYHNGGFNGNITSSIDFSNTNLNLVVEFDSKLAGTWNRLYVDNTNTNYFDIGILVNDGVSYTVTNGIIKLISTSGGTTYARCDMRIKNVYIKE